MIQDIGGFLFIIQDATTCSAKVHRCLLLLLQRDFYQKWQKKIQKGLGKIQPTEQEVFQQIGILVLY